MTESHYDKLILGSGIIGANVGTYACTKENSGYIFGAVTGGFAGLVFGAVSPIVIPGILLGGPGYALAKLRSSPQESPPKEGTLVDLTGLEHKMKEAGHA